MPLTGPVSARTVTLESFLRGHVDAFGALGGVARTLVYDNLRSAVLDRRGAAIQFHPRLLERRLSPPPRPFADPTSLARTPACR